MIFRIPDSEIRRLASRFRPNEDKMAAVGFFLHNQAKDRFASHGASSGGVPWPQKWTSGIGRPDGRAPLTGPSGDLLRSFDSYGTKNAAVLYSSDPHAHVHQKGTIGKGGELPTIVPVNKKALYIPISERAKTGWNESLVRGSFKDGALTPPNADYVLLPRVDIPPRPMLPASDSERAEQLKFVASILTEE